jgi:hypothetical protein
MIGVIMVEEKLTPQQIRLQKLAESRNWGPFTDAEEYQLNKEAKRSRTKPGDVQRPDFSGLVRRVTVEEWRFLQAGGDYLKTIKMPSEERSA